MLEGKLGDQGQRRLLKDLALFACLIGDLLFFSGGMMLAYYIRFDTRIASLGIPIASRRTLDHRVDKQQHADKFSG